MMEISAFLAITPQLIVASGIVLAMLLVAWQRSQLLIASFSFFVILLSSVALCSSIGNGLFPVTTLLMVDDYSRFTLLLINLVSLFVIYLSKEHLAKQTEVHDEYYLLILLVVLGAGVLVVSDHFASLFLGFELLSISLVGLVGYFRQHGSAVESGFKYLILSASASSFMLLGIAFIYAYTGNLNFNASGSIASSQHMLYQLGFILFFSGMAFKLSLVPFHFWTPDVYQGSSTPVTLLLATVSKCAIFVVLVKCCFSLFTLESIQTSKLVEVVSWIAVLSMIAGNSLALRQSVIKRMLAYSSIAHMGYLLIVVLLARSENMSLAWQTGLFYLTAYLLASVSIFMVVAITERTTGGIDINVEHWRGLFWRQPLLSILVISSILSFAGIPLTAGFIGKFYLIGFAAEQALWLPLGALILGSGIALAYYLPIIFTLFTAFNNEQNSPDIAITAPHRTLIYVFVSLGLIIGVYPDVIGSFLQRL